MVVERSPSKDEVETTVEPRLVPTDVVGEDEVAIVGASVDVVERSPDVETTVEPRLVPTDVVGEDEVAVVERSPDKDEVDTTVERS